MTLAELLE